MPKLFLSVTLLILALSAATQQPVLHWAKSFDANNTFSSRVYNNARTVDVDVKGNVYSAGLFTYSADFDPGPGVFTLTSTSPSNRSIYISKLDSSGNFVWALEIPTLVEFGWIELKVDKTGNIYLASDLRNTADMDPGPGVHIMTPTGFRDAFVVKLDTDGNFIWAKQFGGPGDTGPQATIIELDKDNNVIIGGIFNNTVDFDPGPGVLNITSSAHMQAFIVKLTNSGDLMWAKQFGNGPEVYSSSNIIDIKCDSEGNIIMIGHYSKTVDFDPGPGINNVTSSPGSLMDGFICKLDANGNFVWVKTLGQTGGYNHLINPIGIAIDGMNNILTTGAFIGNYDFDPGPGIQNFASNPHDCFILKLNSQGNFIWVKIIGGTESDTGNDIVVDGANNVYIIGSFGPTIDFDPGPGEFIINSPYYGANAVVKLTPGGDFLYAATFQSISFGSTLFRRMAIDPALNIYVTGFVAGTVDFDPGPGVFPLTGSSDSSPFVLKLGPCVGVTGSTLSIITCDSYELNNQTYDSSGIYLQTIKNSTGCDSLITLNLTIIKRFTEQSITICDGELFYAGGSNQTLSGIYYDTLITTQGCDSIIKTNLTVNPVPDPNLGEDRNLCKYTQLTITPGSYAYYLWQDNSTDATITIGNAGLYWVKVTNNYNCHVTDTMEVMSILEPPTDFLKKEDSVCNYKKLELMPSGSYTNYQWSTGETKKVIEVQRPGTYRLTVTDDNGCTGVDTTIIYAKDCMYGVFIPTAFTPDNNGRNDKFKPIIYGRMLQYKLVVYSRWGSVVFQTSDPEKGWDGTIKGVLQNTNAFIWICTYQIEGSDLKTEKGSVMLIR